MARGWSNRLTEGCSGKVAPSVTAHTAAFLALPSPYFAFVRALEAKRATTGTIVVSLYVRVDSLFQLPVKEFTVNHRRVE